MSSSPRRASLRPGDQDYVRSSFGLAGLRPGRPEVLEACLLIFSHTNNKGGFLPPFVFGQVPGAPSVREVDRLVSIQVI